MSAPSAPVQSYSPSSSPMSNLTYDPATKRYVPKTVSGAAASSPGLPFPGGTEGINVPGGLNTANLSPDDIAILRQQDADTKAAADTEQHKKDLADLRTKSFGGARDSANSYFKNLGLDPTVYSGDIDQHLNAILSGISPTDENPGSAFTHAGQDIYGDLNSSYQQRQKAAVDQLFSPSFETSRVASTLDDPILSGIEKEQRSNADAIIQNMLKRGVLTGTGAAAATGDLDRQEPGVKQKLQTFGDNVLEGGRGQLTSIADKARKDASTVSLGQSFDPSTYSKNADDAFNSFISSLGDQIKSKVSGNLFETTGLSSLGGAAQGAGNTTYDPTAAAGVIDPNSPTPTKANKDKESIF